VAILSDFRYPGGTSASVAEEIRAQAAAGLSTALVQVASPYLKSARRFSPRIEECIRDGSADLALPGETVSARVLVIRQPRIFTVDLPTVPSVEADEVVMVINQGPRDTSGERVYYEIGEVCERVERYFGDSVRWAAIGPLVREQVLAVAPEFPLAKHDWHNIIDPGQWRVDRRRPVGDVPVIGRHGRPDPLKWPRTTEDIARAYPVTGDYRVRVLGGGELATERLGLVPDTWEILPFGSVRPNEFLRTIDYFVYFHDSNLVEAFGRTILEAMASGVPVIIPASFRALFQDAALYATPDEVQAIVRSLHSDWNRYLALSARARAFVYERFGYPSHVARLAELGVQVSASAGTLPVVTSTTPRQPRPAAVGPDVPARVMMLSSNGAGLGHLTRLMSIARRLQGELQPVIATQSYAASVVQQEGYLTEYIPSSNYLNIPARRWNQFLHDRLGRLLETHGPRVVAVDGTVPYNGLLQAMKEHPEVTWVWVRRAMWKRDQGHLWIERGEAFDFVLEPGEFAGAVDEGPTVRARPGAKCVGPISLLDEGELMDRFAARFSLELDDRPAALLQLGAGNINEIASPVVRIARYLSDSGFQLVLAQSPIATREIPAPAGARVVKLYPISRYIRGFDLVVSAAGYNSFHELIGFGVPTVFVPNEQTALDDQVARARFAAAVGASLALYDPAGSELEEVLAMAVRPEVRAKLSQRCAELAIPNGAAEAAAWIGSLLPDLGPALPRGASPLAGAMDRPSSFPGTRRVGLEA
jgi:UDP:flavonoid glycosyltransferase YjiC (YdhE family)